MPDARLGGLPEIAFPDAGALREWLEQHADTSSGVWVRLAKGGSGVAGLSFLELLDAGLCFGWSESTRLPADSHTSLQRFAPRARQGTASPRNLARAARLIEAGLMTPRGRTALGLG